MFQAVVNEDAVGTNLMLKAELQRVKVQLAALHGQPPALDAALATSLAFDDQPNTAAAQAAQVSLRSTCYTSLPSLVPCMAIPVSQQTQGTEFAHSTGVITSLCCMVCQLWLPG